MVAIVVRCPDFKADSCKVRTPIYTGILMSELVRGYVRCTAINCGYDQDRGAELLESLNRRNNVSFHNSPISIYSNAGDW